MSNVVILIAENAPIISGGLALSLKKLPGYRVEIIEANNKTTMLQEISDKHVDILIANPTFGGLTHPSEIRKVSLNPDIKIMAIEYGKLSAQTLALFDDHIHITDDIHTLSQKILPSGKIDTIENKEFLSSREKEIVSLVVKGFTNQEIADNLFLSIHTVITHRRNIARKLEIHSATGLTIYAIVNKIVDLSEIKL